MRHYGKKSRLGLVCRQLVPIFFGLSASISFADDVVDLGTVGTTAGAGQQKSIYAKQGTAAAVAPSQSNLEVGQPQSIVSRAFIEEVIAPTSSYYDILAITPSVSTTPSSNGPGFSDGAKATLRGFQDGQYNMTFDGIPFGDTNDPTHHSISYFPAQVLGGVVVERGPGNASNLGQASYGGTVALLSKAPMTEQNTTLYGSLGTWGTVLEGVAYESGRLKDYGDTTVQANYQYEQTQGYQTYAGLNNTDFVLKFQRPLGDNTVATLFGTYNRLSENLPDSATGPTLAQVATYGQSYLMNNNPADQGYYGYNNVLKTSDFEYLRLQSFWKDGFETDNKLYTYAYNNTTLAGCKSYLMSGQPTHCKTSTAVATGDVSGYDKLNAYRVWGDIFKATQQTQYGLLRMGLWLETANTSRHSLGYDFMTHQDVAYSIGTSNMGSGFIQQSSWNQYQPFAEFEWKPTADLTVTPGYKYVNFTRSVGGPSNQGQTVTNPPQNFSNKFIANLPFLTVNYMLNKQNSVYTQIAQGMVIPTLSSMQNGSISTNAQMPTKTTNYQLGYVHKSDRLVADFDVYYIRVSDSQTYNANLQEFIDSGNLTYKGIEGELTYVLGYGFSGYMNASINTATYDTGNATGAGNVINAPRGTGGLGVLFHEGPWKGALLGKYIGYQYAGVYNNYRLPGYTTLDGNASYTFKIGGGASMFKDITTQFSVFNVLNHQSMTSYTPANTPTGSNAAASSLDMVTFQTPRSVMLTLRANF